MIVQRLQSTTARQASRRVRPWSSRGSRRPPSETPGTLREEDLMESAGTVQRAGLPKGKVSFRWGVAVELLVSRGSRRQGRSRHGRSSRTWTHTPDHGDRSEGTISEYHGRVTGANKKEKSIGEITARVLFDGTHGIDVNRRTRVRDQERGPIAADIKRVLREKARRKLPSFALTTDITKARTFRFCTCDKHWADLSLAG